MNPWLFLGLWTASELAVIAFGTCALVRHRRAVNDFWPGSLVVAILAALFPFGTFSIFVAVFVIGQSSNVAQIAGSDGMDLWTLWFNAWPALFICNPASFGVALLTLAFPPYSSRSWDVWAARVAACGSAACAWYAVIQWFPDA
jgi:hypothetical protein